MYQIHTLIFEYQRKDSPDLNGERGIKKFLHRTPVSSSPNAMLRNAHTTIK